MPVFRQERQMRTVGIVHQKPCAVSPAKGGKPCNILHRAAVVRGRHINAGRCVYPLERRLEVREGVFPGDELSASRIDPSHREVKQHAGIEKCPVYRACGDDVTPANIRDQLENTKGFEGVTGTISYSKESHVPDKTVVVTQAEDGMLKFRKDI